MLIMNECVDPVLYFKIAFFSFNTVQMMGTGLMPWNHFRPKFFVHNYCALFSGDFVSQLFAHEEHSVVANLQGLE